MTEKEKAVFVRVGLSAVFLLLGSVVLFFNKSFYGQIVGINLLLIVLIYNLAMNLNNKQKGDG